MCCCSGRSGREGNWPDWRNDAPGERQASACRYGAIPWFRNSADESQLHRRADIAPFDSHHTDSPCWGTFRSATLKWGTVFHRRLECPRWRGIRFAPSSLLNPCKCLWELDHRPQEVTDRATDSLCPAYPAVKSLCSESQCFGRFCLIQMEFRQKLIEKLDRDCLRVLRNRGVDHFRGCCRNRDLTARIAGLPARES